jgi:hypothetical protein
MSLILVHVSQLNAFRSPLSISLFLRVSVTADHYMGDLRRRESLGYHNTPLSSKDRAVSLFSQNRRAIVVKVAINHFFLSTNLVIFTK